MPDGHLLPDGGSFSCAPRPCFLTRPPGWGKGPGAGPCKVDLPPKYIFHQAWVPTPKGRQHLHPPCTGLLGRSGGAAGRRRGSRRLPSTFGTWSLKVEGKRRKTIIGYMIQCSQSTGSNFRAVGALAPLGGCSWNSTSLTLQALPVQGGTQSWTQSAETLTLADCAAPLRPQGSGDPRSVIPEHYWRLAFLPVWW